MVKFGTDAFERASKTMEEPQHMCWRCGKWFERLTNHHAIPVALKPKKNKTVPVCQKCHNEINKFYEKRKSEKE